MKQCKFCYVAIHQSLDFDLVSYLPMVEFYYNCSINEASKHSPFEVSYGFQRATHADRLLLLTGAPAPIVC